MQRISRQALQEDLYQLTRLLSESHPDPYTAGGGSLAFHRRVNTLLSSIPADGLTQTQFLCHIRPLVASLGDGNTCLFTPEEECEARTRRHPWLTWSVIEQDLYLVRVYQPEQEVLLGARLLALNSLPLPTLLTRMGKIQGYDNIYQNLVHLTLALKDPLLLSALLHQDDPPNTIEVMLTLRNGDQQTIQIPLLEERPGIPLEPDSTFILPPLNSARMCRAFLDAGHQVAYVRADSLLHYRESFEQFHAQGYIGHMEQPLEEAQRYPPLDTNPPGKLEERIALVPAATDLLRDLFSAMRLAHTSVLIIDLRFCPSGNSFFATILSYFLYGIDAMLASAWDEGYQIKRYSTLYFENYIKDTPEEHSEALRNGGYDYTDEASWLQRQESGFTPRVRLQALADLRQQVKTSPTFASEFQKRAYEASWTPKVYVLISAQTYSTGFDTAVTLQRHGACVIGTPSAQSGNCFIDALSFTLQYSRLKGHIAFKRQILFPNNEEQGNILKADHELTYDYLATHSYDPHATIQLALDQAGLA